jgi:hypothetical protein
MNGLMQSLVTQDLMQCNKSENKMNISDFEAYEGYWDIIDDDLLP